MTRRAAWLAAAGAVVTLTGCATGSSRDAERGRERDERNSSVVDTLQQTATANLIASTPTAPTDDP